MIMLSRMLLRFQKKHPQAFAQLFKAPIAEFTFQTFNLFP